MRRVANWGDPGGPGGYDLGVLRLLGDGQPQVSDWDMHDPTDDVITALAGQLRSNGQGMLRGDYSQVTAIQDLMTSGAERLHKYWRHSGDRGIRPGDTAPA